MRSLKFFFHILIFLVLIGNSSCKKDFLEIVDKTVLLKEGYVIDLESTGQFMNGVYVNLALYYLDGYYMPYPEIAADNMKPARNGVFTAAYNWSFSSSTSAGNGDPLNIWQRDYSIIHDCNFVIEKASEYQKQNISKSNELKGQALAIRAMLHFNLVNIFSQSYNFSANGAHVGIPYVKVSDIAAPISRQTVNEVYAEMTKDLTEALQLLPKTNFIRDLMNYQAAKALLSRVYLFKEDYNSSKNLAVEVLKDVPVMTSGYPDNLYTINDVEALFRMSPGNGSGGDGWYASFVGYYSSQTGGVRYVATNDIAQLLMENANDKRSIWVKDTLKTWQIRKFPRGVAKKFYAPEGDYYQTLFRSSEMCLNAAEAYAKLNKEDSARYFIDFIRKRANSSLSSITAGGNALMDSIYKERRKEMAFDGLRMFDLLRWKKGVNRIDAANPVAQTLPYPSNKAIAPLPKADVDLLGLPQNLDY